MRERDIFIEALELGEPAGIASLLDNACQGDMELRGRVEGLLAAHERQLSFILDIPPAGLEATLDQRPLSERSGSIIGPYKLLQQIGEGGMGVVFMAEQTAADSTDGGAENHQAWHGYAPGDRPLRGRAAGAWQ